MKRIEGEWNKTKASQKKKETKPRATWQTFYREENVETMFSQKSEMTNGKQ